MVSEPLPARLTVGSGAEAREIAVLQRAGAAPGLFFLGGFQSDMTGSKATALDAYAARHGLAATRFDYSGHGASGGAFADGTISRWLQEATTVFDQHAVTPAIVIGSSMGAWIALHLATALAGSGRLAGLVLIAPAVDMTRALMWDTWTKKARRAFTETGFHVEANPYGETPTRITRALIEDGDRHLFGDKLIEVGAPVHILQGVRDKEVPWRHAERLVTRLASDDVVLTLVKDGDHRLSRPEDIARLEAAIDGMRAA